MAEKESGLEILTDRRKRTRAIHEEDIEAIVSAIIEKTEILNEHKCLLSDDERQAIKSLAAFIKRADETKWKFLVYVLFAISAVILGSISLGVRAWIKECLK